VKGLRQELLENPSTLRMMVSLLNSAGKVAFVRFLCLCYWKFACLNLHEKRFFCCCRNRVLENDEFANIHAPTVITKVGKIITECCDQLWLQNGCNIEG